MGKIKFFSENLDIQSKRIILRLDLNVPLNEKKIQDKTRILLNLPFLKDLIKKKAKIIILSHLGRPKGIKSSELSLAPIYKFLKEQLETNEYFFMGDIKETKSKFSYLKEGEIILLQNIRSLKRKMMIILQKILLHLVIFILMMLFLVPTENRLLFTKLQNT